MKPRNRWGTAVDPVPFAVVSGLAFMVLLSFGPMYALSLGAPLEHGLGASFAVFCALAVGAYYRLVWSARPELAEELPLGVRAERLFYLIPIFAVVIVGLAIPFVI